MINMVLRKFFNKVFISLGEKFIWLILINVIMVLNVKILGIIGISVVIVNILG